MTIPPAVRKREAPGGGSRRADESRGEGSRSARWVTFAPLAPLAPLVTLVLVALVVGATTLSYPHGRDQATHAYIGLRWLEGAIPYRDTFDIKAPGAFFAHAVAFALFGRHMASIHALDLVASTLPASLLVAFATARSAGARGRAGDVVRVATAYVLLYFGTFDYGGTAQSETWCNLVAALALHAAATSASGRERRAALVIGIAAGGALVFKPPSVLVALACFGFVAAAKGPSLRATVARVVPLIALFALGVVVVVLPVLAYFYRANALASMVDVLFVTTARYARSDVVSLSFVDAVGEVLMAITTYNGVPVVVGAFAIVRLRDPALDARVRSMYRLGALTTMAATAAVVVQRKFYLYHWVILVPPLVVLAGAALADYRFWVRAVERPVAREWALTLLALVACLGGGDGTVGLAHGLALVPRYAKTGSSNVFDDAYAEPGFFEIQRYRALANAIADHARRDESVLVRGFEPQLYILADRRYEGRHFWSYFVAGSVFSQPDRFRDEDWRAFVSNPPKVVVAFDTEGAVISSTPTYEKMGYRRVAQSAPLSVLVREGPLSIPSTCPW